MDKQQQGLTPAQVAALFDWTTGLTPEEIEVAWKERLRQRAISSGGECDDNILKSRKAKDG